MVSMIHSKNKEYFFKLSKSIKVTNLKKRKKQVKNELIKCSYPTLIGCCVTFVN